MATLNLYQRANLTDTGHSDKFTVPAVELENGRGEDQTIGFAAHEEITFDSTVTRDEVKIINLDDTNFVEIGIEVAAAFERIAMLLPGRACNLPCDPNDVYYAKADTAAVRIRKYYGSNPV